MNAADGFEELVAIVETGSVTAAATQLGLPRPTVSRRLKRLEERLAVRLLHRTTRRVRLTEHGRLLYPKARRIVQAARDASEAVRRADGVPRGTLRVALPSAISAEFFADWTDRYLHAYPEVQIELVVGAAEQDLLAGGFDVALRTGPPDNASMIARLLVFDETIAVASPQYLAQAPPLRAPTDLAHHACIVGFRQGKGPELKWPLLTGGSITVRSILATNKPALRAEFAKRHRGIALMSRYFSYADIEEGTLVQVLPDHIGRRDRVNLVYPEREFLDPKTRTFVDHIVACVADARASRTVPE